MTTASAIEFGRPAVQRQSLWRYWRGGLRGSEFTWAVAFLVPYIGVFVAFVAYPVFYGLWMGSKPSLYTEVFSDPIYQQTLVNTVLFVAFGVNLKLFFALMLSGFFMRPGWWVKGLLMIFVLPWAVPALPSFISIHWMLNGEWGLLNNALYHLFGLDGPSWLNSRWLALGSAIYSHVWKWMPFWTVILLAGRMSIPQEIYDAAKVDGATGFRRFAHVSFPLLANLYLVLTLLATIFLLGDFNSVYFVTGGCPARGADAARRSPLALPDQCGSRGAQRGPVGVDAYADLQHHHGVVRGRGRRVQRSSVAAERLGQQLLDRLVAGLLVSRIFLAPVRQQRLHRIDGYAVGADDRLADQLLGHADADPQWLGDHQRGIVDLCDPGVVPGDPVLSDHATLRSAQQPVVGYRGVGDLRDPLRDLHLSGIWQEHSARARRIGADRRRLADPNLFSHLPAADGAGIGRRRDVCAIGGVE